MYPTRGVLAGCCARAASGNATAAPPSSVRNSLRLMSDMGLPPRSDHSATNGAISLPQRGTQVIEADLNCSELEASAAAGSEGNARSRECEACHSHLAA